MTPTRFASVWISTPAHLQAWDRLYYDQNRKPIKYNSATILAEFPHVRPLWGLSKMAIPVVFLASGVIILDAESIRFRPREYRFMGNQHVGLLENAAFDLALPEIQTKERYLLKSSVSEMFDLTFARLLTSRIGMLSDLAVAVGFSGLSFSKARRRNRELLNLLVPTGSA